MQPSNSIKPRLSRKRFFRLPKKLAAQRTGKQRSPRTISPRSIVTWANTQKLNRFTSARSKYSKRNSALSKRRKAWPRALYDRMGQYAKAEPLELRALRIYENALGPDHPDTARANINLAQLYCDKGEFAKAELLAIRALKVGEKNWAPSTWTPRKISSFWRIFIATQRNIRKRSRYISVRSKSARKASGLIIQPLPRRWTSSPRSTGKKVSQQKRNRSRNARREFARASKRSAHLLQPSRRRRKPTKLVAACSLV